jgi:hypothetical protein
MWVTPPGVGERRAINSSTAMVFEERDRGVKVKGQDSGPRRSRQRARRPNEKKRSVLPGYRDSEFERLFVSASDREVEPEVFSLREAVFDPVFSLREAVFEFVFDALLDPVFSLREAVFDPVFEFDPVFVSLFEAVVVLPVFSSFMAFTEPLGALK